MLEIDLIVYSVLGFLILWDLGLMFYMCIESSQDVQELDRICHSHKMR